MQSFIRPEAKDAMWHPKCYPFMLIFNRTKNNQRLRFPFHNSRLLRAFEVSENFYRNYKYVGNEPWLVKQTHLDFSFVMMMKETRKVEKLSLKFFTQIQCA